MANVEEMNRIISIATSGLQELIRKGQLGEPLWVTGPDGSTTILNEEEYVRLFPDGSLGARPANYRCEASRQGLVILKNHFAILEILMNVNRWPIVFCGMVSRALTWDVYSYDEAGGFDGAMQVVMAEFHVPSPVVPTRECNYVRYCKKYEERKWAIVDVSLDSLRPNQATAAYRRRPSGCLIEELPNGCTNVIWIEHVEVDEQRVPTLYQDFVTSGQAFGAKRWIFNLDRHCQRLSSSIDVNAAIGVIANPRGKRGILDLAHRMVTRYFIGVSASASNAWTKLFGTGIDDVRIMIKTNTNEPGRPLGVSLCATHCLRLPAKPKVLFDFFRDENNRNTWDILCKDAHIQKVAHVENGRGIGNSVSILRVNIGDGSFSNRLILQETGIDSTGSFVIYAPVEMGGIHNVLSGGDPQATSFLSSGFAIFPEGTNKSLVTMSFQILMDSNPATKLSANSIGTVSRLVINTVENIKDAILEEGEASDV